MNVISEPLPGIFLLEPKLFSDERGEFVKTFHDDSFQQFGISFQAAEEFFSISKKGVIRGMHFQVPQQDHSKLVYCITGSVLDVLLDLRTDQGTYGRIASVVLSASNRHLLYIPPGIAHGFAALEDDSTMVYKTTTIYSPPHDGGIRWDSFGFDWGIVCPIISKRDSSHPAFDDFVSPF